MSERGQGNKPGASPASARKPAAAHAVTPAALYKDILAMKLGGDVAATTTPLGAGEKESTPKARR